MLNTQHQQGALGTSESRLTWWGIDLGLGVFVFLDCLVEELLANTGVFTQQPLVCSVFMGFFALGGVAIFALGLQGWLLSRHA